MNHPLITTEIISECMLKVSDDPKFWEALAPLPSAEQWQALDRLSRKKKLVFVTHRYERETYDIGQVTCDWLRKHGVSQSGGLFHPEPQV